MMSTQDPVDLEESKDGEGPTNNSMDEDGGGAYQVPVANSSMIYSHNNLIDVPPNVPQSNEFLGKKIFIRECYPLYYEEVLQRLQTRKYVTVTGTPGIGKSIFYLYFFQKYRQENPCRRVLTASFSKERKVMAVKEWYSLEEIEERDASLPHFIHHGKDIPFQVCELYLYDGPPDMVPMDNTRMVAFLSPNSGWFETMRKGQHHLRLYMPMWTPSELKEAVYMLGLELSPEQLLGRIELFGGTARYTLITDNYFLREGKEAIDTALGKIESLDYVSRCFEGKVDLEKVVHRLMHYVRDDADWTDKKLKPASKMVASMIHNKLSQSLDSERQKLMLWLDGAGKAGPFLSWLFEEFVHEIFLKGREFSLRPLMEGISPATLVIEAATGNYKRFKLEEPLEEMLVNAYNIPDAPNLQSIDSYYENESGIWMFQMTRSFNHVEDLDGIVDLLKSLGHLETVKSNPSFAKLVFVVPSKMESKFRKQKISNDPTFEGKTSVDAIMTADCSEINGIGEARKKILNDNGIFTIQQLLDSHKKKPITLVKTYIEEFLKKLDTFQDAERYQKIPQYVIGIDYSPAHDESTRG